MASSMWNLQQRHRDDIMDAFHRLRQPKAHVDAFTQSLSSTEARRIRNQLRDMYHPSPALSLLEKTSFSKAIPPAQRAAETATTGQPALATKDEEAVMRGLFGFDEQKMKDEISRINEVDKDIISQQQVKVVDDSFGFDENVLKQLSSQNSVPSSASVPADDLEQMLVEVDEGSEAPKRSMDWKKWEKFVLSEFEAARMTGELDAAAHRLPARDDPFLSENIQTSEGASPTDADISLNSANLGVDKMCGCEITLSPVCGSDGETYPSQCFADCAGLKISHAGPCMARAEVDKPGSFKMLVSSGASTRGFDKLDVQNLIVTSEIPKDNDSIFGSNDSESPVHQEAGVDFPSLSQFDSRSDARTMSEDNMKPRPINMPFKRVVTQQQFKSNLAELSRVAEQFAPAIMDERLAKCSCHGDYAPVCGKDGKSYPSPCYASCVGVELRHVGSCSDAEAKAVPSSVEEVRDPLCFCSLKEKSVCGTNGVTYTNRCFAECVHVRVQSDGPCYTVKA